MDEVDCLSVCFYWGWGAAVAVFGDTWPISSRQWWHEKSVVVFRTRITKQPESVSSWTHYVTEPEWFMHLSFLICWNKASTFLFRCTSQVFRDKEVRMERTSLKRNAKSIRQFVLACFFPQAFRGEATITLWLICKFWPSLAISVGIHWILSYWQMQL